MDTLKNHTVWTYGMQNADGTDKKGFKWLSQLVDNLFHLSENLERDRLNTLREMPEQSTKLYSSLNFKFKLSEVKNLPMETIDESISKMETVLKKVNNAKTNNPDVKTFENLSRQITDIINQMKHLKLYVAENKILEQLKKNDFSIDTEIFKNLGELAPQDPNGEKGLSSSANYNEIKTKYNQLCTFKDTCIKLNELKNAKTPAEAYGTRSGAKEDLKEYGGDGETVKLLEQHLDEAYTQEIKATSPDIKALEKCFIEGTEMPKGNLQKARRLCETIGEHLKAEALSTYIDDLEKGIDIRKELTKLSRELLVLKDKSTSLTPEKFGTECQKAKKQIENLGEQLKQISDNKITEALGRKLFGATNELKTAQNRVQIKKDLETLQKEINGLKTNPTTEKAVFENIATLSKNIKDNINNPKDENEKTKLQELLGSKLEKLEQDFNRHRLTVLGEHLNKVFNGNKAEGFGAIKQETNIQKAKKDLDTALTELRENLDKEYKANQTKINALNANETLSNRNKEQLRAGYKQAHATENLSFYETYKQKVYNTVDTLKKNTPSLSADALEQLEYDYLTEAGMGEFARTHKTN